MLLGNAAPVLARILLGNRLRQPVDGGQRLGDRRPVLGHSKTYEGIAAALLLTVIAAELLGLDWWLGLVIGVAAMIGDLASSFVKRRLGRPSHAKVPLLDELPEALLPAMAAVWLLPLSWLEGLVVVGGFLLIHALLDPLALRIRRRLGRG